MENRTYFLSETQSLFRCFVSLEDPRVGGRCLHSLLDIVVLTICAVICGANNWKGIELFGREKQTWLKRFLSLPNGIPSHLTIGRVFSLINPVQFQECYLNWVKTICNDFSGDHIPIDGKCLRSSSNRSKDQKAIHLINAYSNRVRLNLASIKTPDKSNEIKGIPPLLKMLDIEGATISIDAMGTQKGIAKLIKNRGGGYVLALKENHKRMHRKVEHLFHVADDQSASVSVKKYCDTKNYDHSRIEERHYTVIPMMYLPQYKKTWHGLQSFVRVQATRYINGETERSTRYYISSLPMKDYKKIAKVVRQHWAVENKLHWKLDVGLSEDDSRIFRGNAAENLAAIRKMVLYLLQESQNLQGIKLKRQKAALNTRFLKKVVGL